MSTGAGSVPHSGEHGPLDSEQRRPDRWRTPALAFAIALLVPAVGVIAALCQPAERLAGTNNVFERFANVALVEGTTACERGEVVPAQTGAVRLSTQTEGRPGPALSVRIVESGGRTVSRGALASGWTGAHADIPVATVGTTLVDAQVCVSSAGPGEVRLLGYGGEDGVLLDGRATGETIRVSYLREGEQRWWSILGTVAHRMGLGRGELFDGAWIAVAWLGAVIALALVLAFAVAGAARSPRHNARRVPLAGWLCAFVAGLSGTAWALITPPFHVPDEVAHFAYAQYLAEMGRLPKENGDTRYSPEEQQALTLTQFYLVVGDTSARPVWTEAQDRHMDAEQPASPVGTGSAQSATNNPPLYYAGQVAPYQVGKAAGLGLLDRLMLMRLFSVALAAITALLSFLFVREIMPGSPWAWTAGGMLAALQPLFGFISSGVQGDALLYAAAALLLLVLARAFRKGLTPRTGAALGGAVAIGTLSKLAFVGMVPGAALAVLVLVWRSRGSDSGAARRGAAVAAAVAVGIVGAYALAAGLLLDRSLLGGGTSYAGLDTAGGTAAGTVNQLERLSYLWQLYLPRLPFMTDAFPGPNPMPNLWLHGIVGQFGWLDAIWPPEVYRWGRWAFVLLALLGVLGLLRAARRGALAGRMAELACYATVAVGLLAVIGVAGYRARVDGGGPFEQARYLLPLLPLYAAGVACAARLWGPRRGPLVAAVLVALALGHVVFAQLLTISRFYG